MRSAVAAFLASALILSWGAGSAGIATAYVDPVAKIVAQDEAVYASSSLAMAREGGWLTPKFLGRYALYKPPVIYWLTAPLIKIFGLRAFLVRLPSILAGAATVALVFFWLRSMMPEAAAMAGAAALLSNHLFFVLSRTGLTDALLAFEITLAMFALSRDSRWLFGVAAGAAIMTKAAAGALPIVVLGVLCLARVKPWTWAIQSTAIAAAVAVPWHLWQLYAHPRWFWAEYVIGEHITWSRNAPHQTTQESQIGFYAKRLVALDPFLLCAGLIAMFRALARRTAVSALALTGGAIAAAVLASVLVWSYRNAAYLLPMYPGVAIAAAATIPKHRARAALGLAVLVFLAKMFAPHAPWGLPLAPETVNPAKAALDAYAALHRPNELIIVEPNDEFYSADLDLRRVRYVYIDPRTDQPRMPIDFEYLGITVNATDFARLDQLRPMFRQRLREFNLDSDAPVATVILARDAAEIAALILSRPEADFYVAPELATAAAHDRWQPARSRVFLLSREVVQRP